MRIIAHSGYHCQAHYDWCLIYKKGNLSYTQKPGIGQLPYAQKADEATEPQMQFLTIKQQIRAFLSRLSFSVG